MEEVINYQNPQTSYPRNKLRRITEYCPYRTDFGKARNPRSKLLGIPIRINIYLQYSSQCFSHCLTPPDSPPGSPSGATPRGALPGSCAPHPAIPPPPSPGQHPPSPAPGHGT